MKNLLKPFCFLFPAVLIALLPGNSTTAAETTDSLFADCKLIIEDPALTADDYTSFSLCTLAINTDYYRDYAIAQVPASGRTVNRRLSLSSPENYGRVNYGNGDHTMSLNFGNNLFLFEAGDQVDIHLQSDTVVFEGKSKDKFTCIYLIQQVRIQSPLDVSALLAAGQLSEAFARVWAQEDSIYRVGSTILARYRNSLNPQVSALIDLDMKSRCLMDYHLKLGALVNSKMRASVFAPIRQEMEKRDLLQLSPLQQQLQTQSYYYSDMLMAKEVLAARMDNSTVSDKRNKRFSFGDLHRRIQGRYDGELRDKLMMIAFYFYGNMKADSGEFEQLVSNESQNNVFQDAIRRFKERRSDGVMVYPFELEDEAGKTHRLADYKGKVLILDFWFTGCAGCASLAKKLKPMIASYRGREDIRFITVNVDGRKASWLKGLASGKYTSDDEVNLSTGDLGVQHPMIRHYNIMSYPQLIIVSKEGKLITVNPPIPTAEKPDTAELNRFIESCLAGKEG